MVKENKEKGKSKGKVNK